MVSENLEVDKLKRTQTELTVRVSRKSFEADGVVSLELQGCNEAELPEWSAGAHIDVIVGDGSSRQYSLCGSPKEREVWRIAVLREEFGRGGSRWLHDEVHEGSTLTVRGPRNHFSLESAPAYLFIAGGIGITPILPMLATARAANARTHLVYCGRSRSTMAFLNQCMEPGGQTDFYPASERGQVSLLDLLADPKPDTLIYCCGPSMLLDAVEQHSSHWPVGSLHLERFSPVVRSESPTCDGAFEVELARSGKLRVGPPERTLLSVLEEVGADVVSSCCEGTCGACVTTVLEGTPDHRDSVLSKQEQASCKSIVPCVSRSHSQRLVLDL
jgi:ferredoxin-NADP reductase